MHSAAEEKMRIYYIGTVSLLVRSTVEMDFLISLEFNTLLNVFSLSKGVSVKKELYKTEHLSFAPLTTRYDGNSRTSM